jgi:hypothetical protein
MHAATDEQQGATASVQEIINRRLLFNLFGTDWQLRNSTFRNWAVNEPPHCAQAGRRSCALHPRFSAQHWRNGRVHIGLYVNVPRAVYGVWLINNHIVMRIQFTLKLAARSA